MTGRAYTDAVMPVAAPAERAASTSRIGHRAAADRRPKSAVSLLAADHRGQLSREVAGAQLARAGQRPSQVPVRLRLGTDPALGPGSVSRLQRKCACGGAGTSCECDQKKGLGIQTKVKVGPANDPFEQEADQVAETVMRLPTNEPVSATAADASVQRTCSACEQKDDKQAIIRRHSIGREGGDAEGLSHGKLTQGGSALSPGVRNFFESRFGRDFSSVRVHTGSQSHALNTGLNSHAFTYGSHIWLANGDAAGPSPLMAHELAHVVQQSGLPTIEGQTDRGSAVRRVTRIGNANGAEIHSKQAATYAPQRQGTERLSPLPRQAVQRQPAPPRPQPTRAEEVRLSFTSPGEIAVVPNPPTLSLYNFAIDEPALKEKHFAAIQTLASLIKQFTGGTLSVAAKGHADSSGEDTINDPLSHYRALSVQKALESAAGVPVPISSCGEHCPVVTNDTVEGRSRNRRVDISLSSSKKGDDIDWPSLCAFAPELCFCLKNPTLCREDGDGDGIHWPSLCPGALGKLICGAVLCLLAGELCLTGLCRMLPEICLLTVCIVFPSLCKGKQKPSKDEPKRGRACPKKVDLPSGVFEAHKKEEVGFAYLYYPFAMDIDFDQNSSGCQCECGEYEQLVRGYFEVDDTGTGSGPWKRVRKELNKGVILDETDFQEDGISYLGSYGHRYWDDETRTDPKRNQERPSNCGGKEWPGQFTDQFLRSRETGCQYRGRDMPCAESAKKWLARVRMNLEFIGAPVDVCMVPGQRIRLLEHQSNWTIKGEAQAKAPPTAPRRRILTDLPVIVRGMPKNPTALQDVTLEIAVQGEPPGCSGRIPVGIIAVDEIMVTCITQNSELVQLAPDICPDIWVRPYETLTVFR